MLIRECFAHSREYRTTEEEEITNESPLAGSMQIATTDARMRFASKDEEEEVLVYHDPSNRIIKEIIVNGNIHVPTDAILDRIPYRVGEPFDLQKNAYCHFTSLS